MSGKKKRGLSLDDKRQTILSIYHETLEPYNLKEIETLASKKGVVSQSVKDVNMSLVHDSMVQTDKIGAANFFWSFPAKVYQEKLREKEIANLSVTALVSQTGESQNLISTARENRKAPDRDEKIERLYALLEQEKQYDVVIEANKLNDPEEIKKLEAQIRLNKDGADRWTDNIWAIKKYLTKKKGMSGKEVDKILKIDGDFDYVTGDEVVSKKAKR